MTTARFVLNAGFLLGLVFGITACGGGASAGASAGTGAGTGGTGAPTTPAPAPVTDISGTAVTWSDYKLLMPAGMTLTHDGTNGYVAMDIGACRISLWPKVAADADQDAQALALLTSAFSAISSGVVVSDWDHVRGIAGDGWTYVDLKGYLKNSSGIQTQDKVRILLAKLGNNSAYMIGNDRGTSTGCLDESYASFGNWVPIFYSLSFPNFVATDSSAMGKALIGGWFGSRIGTSVSTYWSDTFAANSHYLHTDGMQSQFSAYPGDSLVYVSNVNWAGDGYWAVSGNKLTTWPSDPAKQPKTEYVRVFQSLNTSAATGWDTYFMRLGTLGGIPVEQYATKQK